MSRIACRTRRFCVAQANSRFLHCAVAFAPASVGMTKLGRGIVHKSFAGHKRQDSANQLNPVLFIRSSIQTSEAQDNAGRQAHVVLRGAEEAGPDVVALEAPGYGTNDAVIQAASERGGEGTI